MNEETLQDERKRIEAKNVYTQLSDFVLDFLAGKVASPIEFGRRIIQEVKIYSDFRFCDKLLRFFEDANLDENGMHELADKIGKDDTEKKENLFRLFDCIQVVMTYKQVHYISNATRILISNERSGIEQPEKNRSDFSGWLWLSFG